MHDVACPLSNAGPKRRSIPKPSRPLSVPKRAQQPKRPQTPQPSTTEPKPKMSKKERRLQTENNKLQAEIALLSKQLEKSKSNVETVTQDLEKEKEWWSGKFGSDQIAAVMTGNSMGRKWSMESVIKGLQVRTACGSSGLRAASKVVLPGERTLQRRTQNVEFKPGVLRQILKAFEKELENVDGEDKDYFFILIFFLRNVN